MTVPGCWATTGCRWHWEWPGGVMPLRDPACCGVVLMTPLLDEPRVDTRSCWDWMLSVVREAVWMVSTSLQPGLVEGTVWRMTRGGEAWVEESPLVRNRGQRQVCRVTGPPPWAPDVRTMGTEPGIFIVLREIEEHGVIKQERFSSSMRRRKDYMAALD